MCYIFCMTDDQGLFPRVSRTEALILRALIANGPLYGLQLARKSNGAIKRNSVYVLLSRLVDKGYIVSEEGAEVPARGGMPRPLYRATGLGQRMIEAIDLAHAHLFQAQ